MGNEILGFRNKIGWTRELVEPAVIKSGPGIGKAAFLNVF